MTIRFSHIAPKSCIGVALGHSDIHMALYHLTNDENYCRAYREATEEVILDNSWFELGKCPPVADMIEAAKKVGATYVVLRDGTLEGLYEFKAAGFKVIAVPAGPYTEDLFRTWLHRDDVDLIGLSFTHASRAMGAATHDPASRFNFLKNIGRGAIPERKLHMLGMGDSVHEILLLKPFWDKIYSWDSSSAVWNGLFDVPVATMPAKNSRPVDFNTLLQWTEQCTLNIQYIHSLLRV